MKNSRLGFVVLLSGLILGSTALGSNLGGKWELQTLGADRDFTVQQKGNKLTAHRVLWPKFEGERYKLEHLFKGRIKAGKVKGKLLVREDGAGEFEALRSFVGSINSDSSMVIDGLPLKRVEGSVGSAPQAISAKRGSALPGSE